MTEKKFFWPTVITVAAIAIASTGFFLWKYLDENRIADAGQVENVASTEACKGDFIDTHLHFDDIDFFENLIPQMKQHRIGCAIAFINMGNNGEDPREKLELVDENPGLVIPFFHVDPRSENDLAPTKLQEVINRYPGYFRGFGEIAFYRPPFQQSNLRDQIWSDLMDFLLQNDLWLQFHLRNNSQLPEFEELIAKHPDNKFLLHGPELYAELPMLLQKYNNLYFTLDTASLIEKPGFGADRVLMYPHNMKKDGFTSYFDENYQAILDSAVSKWKPVFDSAPDRVMWGTDGSISWHADKDIYNQLIRFSNDFITSLNPEYREPFTHQNASRLFLSR
ncbi:MAG: Amidohydrolase [bacterium ADurb.Bin400]|nr:MAG: Amidohydrolase [bacterium ADurb.Bin400]